VSRAFGGFIHFNDLPYADRVNVFAYGSGIHFGPGDRPGLLARKIGLSPIPATALVVEPERMRSGFFYSIQGTKVGGCSEGPLGHPGDGEFDIWPVVEFSIAAKYTSDMLTLGVSGSTGEGVCGFKRPDPLKPWKFRIEVHIPWDAIADALSLPPPERRSLQETRNYLDAPV
jgi:hypothetical protein